MNENEKTGIWALNHSARDELAVALLNRDASRMELAKAKFQKCYPKAPEAMISTAVFHVYVDGPGAVRDWLADCELFLRDPNHRIDPGASWDLLNHVYNWLLFEAMLPEGTAGLLGYLEDAEQALV